MNINLYISFCVVMVSLLLTQPVFAVVKDEFLTQEYGNDFKSASFDIRFQYQKQTGRIWKDVSKSERREFLVKYHEALEKDEKASSKASQEELSQEKALLKDAKSKAATLKKKQQELIKEEADRLKEENKSKMNFNKLVNKNKTTISKLRNQQKSSENRK